MSGLLQYAGIIAGTSKFIIDYTQRAKDLGINPVTTQPYNIVEAIQYDIKNFDSAAAMLRLQAALPAVLVEGVVGYGLRSSKVDRMLKGYGRPAGDIAIAVGVETAIKAILDPPVLKTQPAVVRYRLPQSTQTATTQKTTTGWSV